MMPDGSGRQGDLIPIKQIIPEASVPQLTVIQRRLLEAGVMDEDLQRILYQHTIFCQTSMPYRDPGDSVRSWERSNGIAALEIEAGKVMHPEGRFVEVGLPFGPKPRLILAHINTEVLRTGSAEIETARSLTAWAARTLKVEPAGRDIKAFRQQLVRLAACRIRLGMVKNGHAITVQSQVVSAFDLWLDRDVRQRTLWPQMIRISADYFASIQEHAVPLDEDHLAALAHTAMGIDVYSWLAQRLHRIPAGKGIGLGWPTVALQFGGEGYARLRKFRENFLVALRQVLAVYRTARVEPDERGLQLWKSPPPVPPRALPR